MKIGRHDLRQRWSQLSRLFGFTADQRAYLRLVKKEAALDREYYLSAHRWLHPVFQRFPERHYVAIGEEMGLSPAPWFAPNVYRHHNPEIPATTAPLWHFLTSGRAAGLIAVEPDHVDPGPPQPLVPQSRVAVVAHVHYLDVWPELVDQLRSSGVEADLFVTTTTPVGEASQIEHALGSCCPNRSITSVPNRGRDVGSFVYLINAGVLDPYEAVCKIHTKQSPGRGGTAWRSELLGALLPADVTGLIDRFLSNERALTMTSASWIRSGVDAWGLNRDGVSAMLARVDASPSHELAAFPAGSMYWIKPAALQQIQSLRLGYQDFEHELGRVDGTTAHAFERVIGFLCQRAGGTVVAASAPRLDA